MAAVSSVLVEINGCRDGRLLKSRSTAYVVWALAVAALHYSRIRASAQQWHRMAGQTWCGAVKREESEAGSNAAQDRLVTRCWTD